VLSNPNFASMLIFLSVFVVVSIVGYLLALKASSTHRRAITRVRNLPFDRAPGAHHGARPTRSLWVFLATFGSTFQHGKEQRLAVLRAQLLQAGIANPSAVGALLGARLLLGACLAAAAALVPQLTHFGRLPYVCLCGLMGGVLGMQAPLYWLSWRVRRRQRALRAAIPDALDMLILCLEAGVSLPAALQRVTDELHLVHPLLGQELRAIEGQMRLGLSPAQALKRFGEKSGLIELRDLASILLQSEQTGASIVKALRAHADDSRQDRYASAQEHAQKTAVKILFPMLLCIFPAVFIVLLGPAAFQLATLFKK